MKKTIFLLVAVAALVSCNSDNDPCGGAIPDLINQTLFLELVDENGTNLIESGQYDPTEIETEFNGIRGTALVFTEGSGASQPYLNTIGIGIVQIDGQESVHRIFLGQNEIDTLIMDLSVSSRGCSGVFYDLNALRYNGQNITFEEVSDAGAFFATVIK